MYVWCIHEQGSVVKERKHSMCVVVVKLTLIGRNAQWCVHVA